MNEESPPPKRLKACLKQVVSGAFASPFNSELEVDIVNDLITECKKYQEDERLPLDELQKSLDEAVSRLMPNVKRLLGPRLEVYLKSIVGRLFDTSMKLNWDIKSNNCQNFCDSILEPTIFRRLTVAPSSDKREIPDEPSTRPLYLMSFVCRPESYRREQVESKFDVPNGLMEEYFLKFRKGRHDDADVVDTLQEYWHDWGESSSDMHPCPAPITRYKTNSHFIPGQAALDLTSTRIKTFFPGIAPKATAGIRPSATTAACPSTCGPSPLIRSP